MDFRSPSLLAKREFGPDAFSPLAGGGNPVVFVQPARLDLVLPRRERIDGDLVIWGSLTLVDALLGAGEVDMLRLRVVPVLLGGGRPLAPPGTAPRRWRLARVESFGGGVAVLEYHALA